MIFGTSIDENGRVPYSADRVLERAATLLDYDSKLETPEEVAVFSSRRLGIRFPASAIRHAKRKQQTELHSVDLRTLCYLIEGHGHWYRTHGWLQSTSHSLHIHARRGIFWMDEGPLSIGQRITATARRIGRLPIALRNNRVTQTLIDYLKI